MVLIDTSCWTQTLRRKGDVGVRQRVNALLANNQAAWCDVIRLELWNGATNEIDRQLLMNMEARVSLLPITGDVWNYSCSLAHRAKTSGLKVPAIDLIIFSCAKVHCVPIEHVDKHYILLDALK